jgi:hypothetical protein
VALRQVGTGRAASVLRSGRWAASHELSQLQTALYGRVHDAILQYARQEHKQPGRGDHAQDGERPHCFHDLHVHAVAEEED